MKARQQALAGSAAWMMVKRPFQPHIMFNLADAAGANNGSGGQQQNNGGGQQQQNNGGQQNGGQNSGGGPSADGKGGQAPGANGAAAPYRPEGLPDHLFGANDKEIIDKVWGAYKGSRDEIATRGTVPKEAKAYTFTPSEKVKPYVKDLDNDGFFQGVREDALAAGVTDKQFPTFINKVMERMLDSGMAKPVDYEKEMAALIPDAAKSLDEKGRKAAVSQRIGDALAWVEGARKQGLPEDVANALTTRLGDDSVGVRAIEWIKSQAREIKPALGGHGAGGAISESELEARTADPRNQVGSMTYDKKFAEETRRLYQQAYPG